MAIDNSLYDELETTYFKMKNYLESNQLGPEHSQMIIKHEELAQLLESLDIEAIEEQSSDIHSLHNQLNQIKEIASRIIEELESSNDSNSIAQNAVTHLNEIFLRLQDIQK